MNTYYKKLALYILAIFSMFFLGWYIQSLKNDITILQKENANYNTVLKIKDAIITRLDGYVQYIDKATSEREQKIAELQEKMNNAKILLNNYKENKSLSDTDIAILRSLGIVWEEGCGEGTNCNLQGNTPSDRLDATNSDSENERQNSERPSQLDN